MGEAFSSKGLDSPRLLAEMLLAHVVGCDRLRLYTDPDRPASDLEREQLRDLVARALRHEPVQYLVGHAWFFGLKIKVDRRVLIPRPATETIVEHVLQDVRARRGQDAARGEGLLLGDVCTGSGCIAVALAKRLREARVVACDLSEDALTLARENAQEHDVADRLDLLRGDLLEPLLDFPATRSAGSLDYLVANPPYIPDDEWEAVAPNVRDHEPHGALRGGADGLDLVRRLLTEHGGAAKRLRAGGLLLIEVADSKAETARGLVESQEGLGDVLVVKDFEGLARVVVARRV